MSRAALDDIRDVQIDALRSLGTRQAVGVITIAGPLLRLHEKRMLELGKPLLAAASELGMAAATSPLFIGRR